MDMGKLAKKQEQFQKKKHLLMKNTKFLQDYESRFMVKYTYDSTSIEGNSLTLEDTKNLLLYNRTPANKDLREIYEQINHKNAFGYIATQIKKGNELNETIALKTHELVVQNIFPGGTYRCNLVSIQGSEHECPLPEELPMRMKDFYEKLQQKNVACGMPESGITPIDLACWTHCEFVSIHPFRDGNGRTSRLMMNYQLLRHGYLPVSVPVERKQEYYQALENFHMKGDSDTFKKFICDLEEQELDYMLEKVQALNRYMDMEGEFEIGG